MISKGCPKDEDYTTVYQTGVSDRNRDCKGKKLFNQKAEINDVILYIIIEIEKIEISS